MFFSVFKEIDPIAKIPKKGAWYTCVFVCVVCFFLDLEKLSKIISLGNLLNYSFVNAGVIALRFRPKATVQQASNYGAADASDNSMDGGAGGYVEVHRGKNEKFAWVFLVIAFMFAMAYGQGYDEIYVYSFGALTLGALIFLSTLP